MSSVQLRIPFPPSTNAIWRSRVVFANRRRAKPFVDTYLTPVGRQYRQDVQAAILKAHGLLRPSQARVAVSIVAVMPDRRRRDIDNLLKSSLDALIHARVIQDDGQVDDLRITRGPVRPPGWLEVTITKLADAVVQPGLEFTETPKAF